MHCLDIGLDTFEKKILPFCLGAVMTLCKTLRRLGKVLGIVFYISHLHRLLVLSGGNIMDSGSVA